MLLNLAILLVAGLTSVKAKCQRHGVPCLEYTVLQTHEGYEERAYPSIVWVSATGEAARKMDISRSLINLLYAYLRGANDREEKLEMVVPVRTRKIVNGDENIYTMAIALTPEQGENPPVPLNPNVTVTREPETVYVTNCISKRRTRGLAIKMLMRRQFPARYLQAFGGQARQDEIWDNQADSLREAVSNDDSVDTSFYYMSVYDSPWHQSIRLNEVWMVKRED